MKNQFEILMELFREVLGTLSIEELTKNGALEELTIGMFNEFGLKD